MYIFENGVGFFNVLFWKAVCVSVTKFNSYFRKLIIPPIVWPSNTEPKYASLSNTGPLSFTSVMLISRYIVSLYVPSETLE